HGNDGHAQAAAAPARTRGRVARPAPEACPGRTTDAAEADRKPDPLHARARDGLLPIQHPWRSVSIFQRVSLSTSGGVPNGIRTRVLALKVKNSPIPQTSD